MSDVSSTTPSSDGIDWSAPVDPAFQAVWGEVFGEETDPNAVEGAAPTEPGADGGETPAPTLEGDGAAPAGTAEPTGAEQSAPPASAAMAGEPAARPGEVSGIPAESGAQSVPSGHEYATVAPLFATASEKMSSLIEANYRSQAIEEVRQSIDPKFIEALNQQPYWLVGKEVPSMRDGEQKIVLRDVSEAREWREAVEATLAQEIDAKTQQRLDGVKDMTSVLQESILLFQNNKDIVPNTKEYDAELVDQFTQLAKTFELRVDGKMYGYRVPVQDLLNQVRTQVATQRAQNPKPAATPPVSDQPRDPATGQYQAPQGGITSKSPLVGGDGEDDYSAFWSGTPFKNVPGISI